MPRGHARAVAWAHHAAELVPWLATGSTSWRARSPCSRSPAAAPAAASFCSLVRPHGPHGCDAGEVCCYGTPFVVIGVCADLLKDDRHCGDCPNDCTKYGKTCCNGACTDVKSDVHHCDFCEFDC